MNTKYWTLIAMRPEASTAWDIAVPNGSYQVTIVAGGPFSSGYAQLIRVEDVLVVDGLPTDYAPRIGGTLTVTVSDEKLTVSDAEGATSNRLCYIEIIAQQ